MKVVAYSIKPFEKEYLAKANQKKHEITLISNSLSLATTAFAEGKDAVVVSNNDDVSANVITQLAALGIKYIATRCLDTFHIDKEAAAHNDIKLAYVPVRQSQQVAGQTIVSPNDICLNREALQQIADQTIKNLDLWQQGKCVGKACICVKGCGVRHL
jgi:lactate dehydrogenase-like 2-hydroxyacid dehydrogenase